MSSFLAVMKVAAINQYMQWLPSLDAISNTTSFMKKITTGAQVVGFAGAIAIGAGCFALMAWGGERLRDKIKTHLIWVFLSVIGLFAIAAIATLFKTYSQSSFN
ncbi:hypothetical protein [Lactiplantibacillus plantarum]|uniref:hypothetical protein n=1 Tax=Lactiplantibacillus plantarum TaxID=1590 RepID=UPI001BA671FE|nr:hypothetical protein [Lactiplantibacillus plantarum]MBS0955436.1 hypothetical protein [Lactiplantibacillus plantarum]